MIDREARNRLLRGVEDYMDEKMPAAEFLALLQKDIAPHTADEVIRQINFWVDVYELNDSNTIHPQYVRFYWQFLNRIRLLLISDAEYDVETLPETLLPRLVFLERAGRWTLSTLMVLSLAGAFLLQSYVLFLVCFYSYVLCGLVMFMTFLFNLFNKPSKPVRHFPLETDPFESFADLLAVRRSVPDFASKRFPDKPLISTASRNRLIRFLWDTKCPVWVDRTGDAFMTAVVYVLVGPLFILSLIVFLPLLILPPFRQTARRTLVINTEPQA